MDNETILQDYDLVRYCSTPLYSKDEVIKLLDLARADERDNKWISEADKARFWSMAKNSKYCWNWQGCKNKDGYGKFRHNFKVILAHRMSYLIINGTIGDGMLICHTCDNPSCVNPSHLFEGTHEDNMADMKSKGRNVTYSKTSKYIGVSLRRESNTYRAYFYTNKKTKYIGTFQTEIEAAIARDKYVSDKYPNEQLNFPLPTPPKQ